MSALTALAPWWLLALVDLVVVGLWLALARRPRRRAAAARRSACPGHAATWEVSAHVRPAAGPCSPPYRTGPAITTATLHRPSVRRRPRKSTKHE
ncbi:hypothetical protein [Streptomyces sp. NPDC058741]|uniref:hypothetical protein n=1 Tax=Streptomyces sp. NPDC058741 TaxID=3346620 RepID=UPI0036A6244F